MSQPDSFPQPINPYAPTIEIDAEPMPPSVAEAAVERITLRRTAIRWFAICFISAAPSFVWGMAISQGQIAAMLLGILVFATLYTYLDYRTATCAFRQNTTTRRTLKIAYGTRIAISIVFPIGMYLDLFCGMVSLTVTGSVGELGGTADGSMTFVAALLTTLVQGVVLNIVIGGYALLVHLAQWVVITMRR